MAITIKGSFQRYKRVNQTRKKKRPLTANFTNQVKIWNKNFVEKQLDHPNFECVYLIEIKLAWNTM